MATVTDAVRASARADVLEKELARSKSALASVTARMLQQEREMMGAALGGPPRRSRSQPRPAGRHPPELPRSPQHSREASTRRAPRDVGADAPGWMRPPRESSGPGPAEWTKPSEGGAGAGAAGLREQLAAAEESLAVKLSAEQAARAAAKNSSLATKLAAERATRQAAEAAVAAAAEAAREAAALAEAALAEGRRELAAAVAAKEQGEASGRVLADVAQQLQVRLLQQMRPTDASTGAATDTQRTPCRRSARCGSALRRPCARKKPLAPRCRYLTMDTTTIGFILLMRYCVRPCAALQAALQAARDAAMDRPTPAALEVRVEEEVAARADAERLLAMERRRAEAAEEALAATAAERGRWETERWAMCAQGEAVESSQLELSLRAIDRWPIGHSAPSGDCDRDWVLMGPSTASASARACAPICR
jgi:hypothetical protein